MRHRLVFSAIAAALSVLAGAATAAAAPPPLGQLPSPAAISSPLTGGPLVDPLGRPTPQVIEAMRVASRAPALSDRVSGMLEAAAGFFEGSGTPGVPLPDNAPRFAQFGWPSVADNCIGGSLRSVGTAIAVPGPADLPLPGVPAGHTAFVFTALGTGTATATQPEPMEVTWVNLASFRSGTTRLTYNSINPDGPATLNGLADTGSGPVVALLQGAVTTTSDQSQFTCRFLPTVGFFTVR
ncbi:hypothetical protein ACFSSC_07445 [Corynebacterium mendelii]|uniref:Rv1157c family protein n=1 Tax=Corynebacterium mendelii TaxID=2765362 RepID=UPI002ED1512F